MFTYTASDEAGKLFTATVTVTVKEIDKTPPVSSAITTPGPNSSGWNNQDVQVTISASDKFGVAAIMYKLDEAAWSVYQGPLIISSEGKHNLSFYAADLAGNKESSKNLSILIDKTLPVINGAP